MEDSICKMRLVLCLALCLMLSLLLVACAAGPEDTIRNFHEALERGELENAVNLLEIGDAEGAMKEKYKAALSVKTREIRERGGITSVKIAESEVWEEIADLQVEVTYGDGTVEKEKVSLVKKDGEWKIRFGK